MNVKTRQPCMDLRESLYNDRAVGLITDIQLPAERITKLHGIMFDFDPKILVPGNSLFPPAETPEEFYAGIKSILELHALARHAEVRVSGTGLHLLVRIQPAVELKSAADQQRSGKIVKVVQRTLPVDPDMPGITAVTRPIGSVNGKNGAIVKTLKPGEAIAPEVVEQFMALLALGAFREVGLPLVGEQRVHPCPVCRGDGTRLDLLDWIGMCYGNCGKITLEHLFDSIYLPRPTNPKGPAALPPFEAQTALVTTKNSNEKIKIDEVGKGSDGPVRQQLKN